MKSIYGVIDEILNNDNNDEEDNELKEIDNLAIDNNIFQIKEAFVEFVKNNKIDEDCYCE